MVRLERSYGEGHSERRQRRVRPPPTDAGESEVLSLLAEWRTVYSPRRGRSTELVHRMSLSPGVGRPLLTLVTSTLDI